MDLRGPLAPRLLSGLRITNVSGAIDTMGLVRVLSYGVLCTIEAECILIVVVMHGKRQPGCLHGRKRLPTIADTRDGEMVRQRAATQH